MQTIARRITTPLFALLFTASLAFGVTTSFAQAERVTAAVPSCPNNNDDLLGDCDGYPEVCDFRCKQRGYDGGDCIGSIEGDCCVCRR
jgi:hypothetical protein